MKGGPSTCTCLAISAIIVIAVLLVGATLLSRATGWSFGWSFFFILAVLMVGLYLAAKIIKI